MSGQPSDPKIPQLKDLIIVVRDVREWHDLGLELGLPEPILAPIATHPDTKGHLRMMLSSWLQYDLNASWEKLATALSKIGKNTIAANIRQQAEFVEHQTTSGLVFTNIGQLSDFKPPELKDLVIAMRDVKEWHNVGLMLGLPEYILASIAIHPDTKAHVRMMLSRWLMFDINASWEKLTTTLSQMGKDTIAASVRQQAYFVEQEAMSGNKRPVFKPDDFKLSNLENTVRNVAEWYDLGLQLGLPEPTLIGIARTPETGGGHHLFMMLTKWLQYDIEPSWEKLAYALDIIGKDAIAASIRQKQEDKRRYHLNLLLEKEGYVELSISKLLITGAAGSGKTCTKHILYKLPPPRERVSTELIEEMDRAYVAREIDHNLGYFTESAETANEYDWIIVHSDNQVLYSMIAATISDNRDIYYPRKFDNSSTNGGSDQSALSSNPVVNIESPYPMQISSPNVPVVTNDSQYPMQMSPHQPTSSGGKKLLLKEMKNPRSVGNCVHQVHWIHFLDSGGQSAFHDILPAFVHNISVLIFVLKLSEAMDEQPFDDYYERGERIGDTKSSPYQVKEILKSIIQSICSEKNCSKLLIIGTHADVISTKESMNDKNAILKSLLHSFVGKDQLDVLCRGDFDKEDILFPLNAKDQDEKSKEEAKTIRKRIVNGCKVTKPLKIPVSWFLLEEDLRMSSIHREHGILNKSECQPIARSLNITSLSDALDYFHSLNIFLYFPYSQLSNLVFTKPQIAVTIVSRLVKIAYRLRGGVTDTRFINYAKRGQFTKDLILQEEDIARFIDHSVGFEIEHMIELLRITLVIAPISKERYFIPCVLDYCPPDEIKNVISTQCVAPMVIKLPGECVPRGFFCALTCSLLSQWKLHELEKVYRDFIRFDIEGEGYSVAIVDSFFYISIHVFGNCGRKGCSKIQTLVKASVKEIITKHNYEKDVFRNDSMLFLCPCGKVPEHFAQLLMEENLELDQEILRLRCAICDNQHLDLTKEHAVWFTDEQYSKWNEQTRGTVTKQPPQVHSGPQSLQRTMQEVIASIPTANWWKLDKEIDFENLNEKGERIPQHLGSIATSMINWEDCIADELGLTDPDRIDIFQGRYALNPGLQRREVLIKWKQKHGYRATYRALIIAFIKVGRRDCADRVCQTLLESAATGAGALPEEDHMLVVFNHSMSEEKFSIWLKSRGVGEKDCKALSENGVAPSGFAQLDAEDFDDLGLTKIGKKLILKALAEVKLLPRPAKRSRLN